MNTHVQTEGDTTTLQMAGKYVTTTFNIQVVDQGIHITGTWSTTSSTEERKGELAVFPVSPHELCVEIV